MTDEKTGYKCPPRHTRFKPGTNANPLGRGAKLQPKHADVVSRLLNASQTILVGGKKTKMTRLEAMVKRIGDAALRGNIGSANELLRLRKFAPALDEPKTIIFVMDEDDEDVCVI